MSWFLLKSRCDGISIGRKSRAAASGDSAIDDGRGPRAAHKLLMGLQPPDQCRRIGICRKMLRSGLGVHEAACRSAKRSRRPCPLSFFGRFSRISPTQYMDAAEKLCRLISTWRSRGGLAGRKNERAVSGRDDADQSDTSPCHLNGGVEEWPLITKRSARALKRSCRITSAPPRSKSTRKAWTTGLRGYSSHPKLVAVPVPRIVIARG